MICAGNLAPIGRGANVVDLCYPHFEPPERAAATMTPAFALHAAGVSADDQSAVFALVPAHGGDPLCFTARWGRAGVGPNGFMPVPAQIEDARPGIEVYGFKSSNFNWRSCQWEISATLDPADADLPSLRGDTVEIPANTDAAYAFRNGAPLANVDELGFGEWPDLGAVKKAEDSGHSYLVHFGGRIWRRWTTAEGREPLELLAFDTASPALQTTLEDVWGEIGGQDDAKRELVRAIQWPVLYPELFLLFKRRRSRGVLLYGPPGCGKTLLGKAVVRLLAALYHRKADDGAFKYVKGHQLLDMYVGQSEKAVKALFDEARRFREEKGYPAVLFFDEADALFRRRAAGSSEGGFSLVPALLAEMDGMDETGAFVMLATNRPDALDLAITRPGRIDRRIRITRPDQSAAARIFQIHLEGVYLDEGLSLAEAGSHAATELFDPRHRLYQVDFEEQEGEQSSYFLLKDLASGALIQNIVDRATANKMDFCIENDVRAGLNRGDLTAAVEEVLAEQRQSRHAEELEEFAEVAGRRLRTARRLGAA